MATLKEPIVFNYFDNKINDNSVIWKACKKELSELINNFKISVLYARRFLFVGGNLYSFTCKLCI